MRARSAHLVGLADDSVRLLALLAPPHEGAQRRSHLEDALPLDGAGEEATRAKDTAHARVVAMMEEKIAKMAERLAPPEGGMWRWKVGMPQFWVGRRRAAEAAAGFQATEAALWGP